MNIILFARIPWTCPALKGRNTAPLWGEGAQLLGLNGTTWRVVCVERQNQHRPFNQLELPGYSRKLWLKF